MNVLKEILLWLAVVLVEAFVISLFLSTGWIYGQIEKERISMKNTMGYELTRSVVDRGDNLFENIFVDTGIMDFTYRIFIPEEKPEEERSRIDLHQMKRYTDLFKDRLDAVWASMYQAIQRFSLFIEWLPYLLPFIIPCIIDGWAIREIKKVSYGYTNAVRYHFAVHAIIALLFLPVLYAFFPIAIPPIVIPFWIFLLGASFLVLTANIQKML